MTNNEANANTPDEPTYAFAHIVDAPVLKEGLEAPAFTEVEPTYTLPRVGSLYRYLNWINGVQNAYSINLENFSTDRQAAVAVLVDHGFVSERRYVGGEQDGRRTFRVTPAGKISLAAAWSAANEVLTS